MRRMLDFAPRAAIFVLTGFVLALCAPPAPLPWPIPFAIAGTAWALADRGPRDWFVAGTTIGAIWFHIVPRAVAPEWGVGAALGMYVIVAATPGVVFLVAGWISRSWRTASRVFALVGVWPLASLILDAAALTPLTFAPAWIEAPQWLAVTRIVGVPGFDALVLLLAGGLALTVRGSVRGGLGISGLALALLFGARVAPASNRTGSLRVAGIQPDVATRDFARAAWSLYERHRIVDRLDAMTEAALEDADLVVWPEGGNELANPSLPRRVARLERMTATSPATILTGSRMVDVRGRIANTASTWSAGRLRETVVKARPVPFAEGRLEPGRPKTVRVADTDVGVSICFDAIFSTHVRALVDAGAEVLVATSDDASLADTRIAHWHSAYARLRAIEAGRALVFVSNAGPTFAIDPLGHRLDSELSVGTRGTFRASVPIVGARTLAHHLALPFALVAFLAAIVGVRRPTRVRATMPATVVAACAVAVAIAGRASATTDSVPAPRDDLSPLFAQTAQKTCGAAALAFSLTFLGDEVFEADVVRDHPPAGADGYSMQELQSFARTRGFAASGWEASTEALEKLGGGIAIARLDIGHFVAVLGVHEESVVLFDPALGQTLTIDRSEFDSLYSGRVLFVTPQAMRVRRLAPR